MKRMSLRLVEVLSMVMMTAYGADFSPYGVCAHITRGEGDEPLLTQTLNAMELAGIGWARSDIDAPRILRPDGTYDFARYDRIVAAAEARGVTLLPIVYGPQCPNPLRTPEDADAFRAYIRAILTHYGKRFPVVEIYNEANLNYFLKGAKPEDYAEILRVAYETVKAVDPEIRVMFTGTAGVALEWMSKVFEAGAVNCFDILNVHPYSYPNPPESNLEANIQKLKALLAEYGRPEVPLWITEIGWPTHEMKEAPFMHIFLAGLKVARPEQKTWNIILANVQPDGDVEQGVAEALLDVLPVGSSVRACAQKETCEALSAGGVDAIVYPYDESFPADTVEAVNEFVAKGGVLLVMGGAPCYFGRRGALAVEGMQNGAGISLFPFGFQAWWLDSDYPESIQLNATAEGRAAGVKEEPTGFKSQRFLTRDRIGPESEWIPLIAGTSESGKELVSAVVIRYKGERTGAAVLCTLFPKIGTSGTNTEEAQALYTARGLGIAFAAGVEAYFPYNLRASENDPYYSEEHFGLMHSNFQPKPAFAAYAQFTTERPAGSVQSEGPWHDEAGRFYYPQWTRPNGVKAGMLWIAGKEEKRALRFVGGTPTFRTLYGRKIAVREVEEGVFLVPLSGAPIYFRGAELVETTADEK